MISTRFGAAVPGLRYLALEAVAMARQAADDADAAARILDDGDGAAAALAADALAERGLALVRAAERLSEAAAAADEHGPLPAPVRAAFRDIARDTVEGQLRAWREQAAADGALELCGSRPGAPGGRLSPAGSGHARPPAGSRSSAGEGGAA